MPYVSCNLPPRYETNGSPRLSPFGTDSLAFGEQYYNFFTPILKAFNITARLRPISPMATASHKLIIPWNAKRAKEPLIKIEAEIFCFTMDIVFLLKLIR